MCLQSSRIKVDSNQANGPLCNKKIMYNVSVVLVHYLPCKYKDLFYYLFVLVGYTCRFLYKI